MNNKNDKLICKNVKFYSPCDKEIFFEWVKKIEGIEDISISGKQIILTSAAYELHDCDLSDLIGLFYRYKIDMKQLQRFVSLRNRRWFMDRIAYWYKSVFGQKGPIIKKGLVFGPLNFFSPEDKELFLDWVQVVQCLKSYRLKKDLLYANLYSSPISTDDLKNLIGIFKRYNLDNPQQLKERFGTKDNQHLFDELLKS